MKTPAKFHSLVRFQFHATGHNASTAKLPAASEEAFRSIPNTALAAPTRRPASNDTWWLFGLQVERRDIESQLDLVGGGCDSVLGADRLAIMAGWHEQETTGQRLAAPIQKPRANFRPI